MDQKLELICEQTSRLTDVEFRALMNKLLKDKKRSFDVMNRITNDFIKHRKKEIKEFNKSKMPVDPNPIGQLVSPSQNQTKKSKKKKGKKGQQGQQGQGQGVQQVQQMMTDTDYLF